MILVGAELIDTDKRRHPEARASLDRWLKVIKDSAFGSIPDLKLTFRKSYDYVPPNCHVFDIAHGRHRLVVVIDFASQLVRVEGIMDHKSYGRWRCI